MRDNGSSFFFSPIFDAICTALGYISGICIWTQWATFFRVCAFFVVLVFFAATHPWNSTVWIHFQMCDERTSRRFIKRKRHQHWIYGMNLFAYRHFNILLILVSFSRPFFFFCSSALAKYRHCFFPVFHFDWGKNSAISGIIKKNIK